MEENTEQRTHCWLVDDAGGIQKGEWEDSEKLRNLEADGHIFFSEEEALAALKQKRLRSDTLLAQQYIKFKEEQRQVIANTIITALITTSIGMAAFWWWCNGG